VITNLHHFCTVINGPDDNLLSSSLAIIYELPTFRRCQSREPDREAVDRVPEILARYMQARTDVAAATIRKDICSRTKELGVPKSKQDTWRKFFLPAIK
jgi:hypothetical protein